MSISRRTRTTVRTLGVASAAAALSLGVAGNAFACNIGELSWVASCDSDSGTATIVVTDTDGSVGSLKLVDKADATADQTKDLPGAKYGVDQVVTFTGVPWKDLSSVTILVTVPNYLTNQPITKTSITGENCTKPTQSPTPTPTPSATTTKPTPTPSATTTTAAPSPSTSSTVDATASPSPTGPVLATTGGGSDTGLIAGLAGAFVVVGAGAVFALRRRSAGTHN
ncbi:LAETG motif-containing sortase-dependent surface protein [Streptacidiphilus sp. N1-12]|uniref:LAETG motif-containing sortase-dependent surface protein n=2 Tax=Streptacidiphilus alkalitolerans TaxID=3342712 RepID=A0ABV6WP26_9ACTN